QAEGQSVTVRLEFDKELQAVSAALGGSALALTQTADASVWTGDVVVPVSSELTVGLVVKDYQDLSGNTGAEDRNHSMPITPTLAITPVGNVDSSNAAALQITGTSSRSALGGSAVALTQTADASVWTGDVVVPVSSELTVGLVVKDYQDLSGNTGAEDSTYSMPITPTITIGTISDVSGNTTVTINGTTTRFEAGGTIALKAVDTDSLVVLGSATVLVDGTWTVDLDLSTLKDGVITVYANGANSLFATADEVNTTFNYSSTTALVVPSYWERYSAELPSQKAA
ncbi:hypothetical protein, partial [Vibrio parahaemolyticus]|uniref:hypothetical protein n=1 Tax=Vibrio parahaemolyticus TaxID=670 RepID=UPI001AA13FF3